MIYVNTWFDTQVHAEIPGYLKKILAELGNLSYEALWERSLFGNTVLTIQLSLGKHIFLSIKRVE